MEPTQEASTQKPKKKRARRINVRTPEVMERVQAEVEEHYRSEVVEKLLKDSGRWEAATGPLHG